MGSSFTDVIDMTRRAQRQRRLEDDESLLEEPDPALPEASLEKLPTVYQQAATAMGWDDLTPVQSMAIPYLLEKRDLIVQAQTGTGKTGAFLLPLMEQLDPEEDSVQALVINPTRELARQTFEEFMKMKAGSPRTNKMHGAIIYGGVGYKKQIADMKKAELVVGTPGRLLDHLKKGNLELGDLRHLIIDEADELLSMGFYPDIEEIVNQYTPEDRHSSLYSATVPYRIQLMAEEFLTDPGYLSLSEEQVYVDRIKHQFYVVPRLEKDDALAELIEHENPESALIFANTKRDVRYVTRFLQNKGYDADQISGDLPQKEREKVMARIRDGELRFLVATDVAARGIDISDLSHVFLYDVPQDREFYIHRSGRTARAGKSGTVVVLATINEKSDLKEISSHYDIDFERRELPSQAAEKAEEEAGEEREEEAGEGREVETSETAAAEKGGAKDAESAAGAGEEAGSPAPEQQFSPERQSAPEPQSTPSTNGSTDSPVNTESNADGGGTATVVSDATADPNATQEPSDDRIFRNPDEAPTGAELVRKRAPRKETPSGGEDETGGEESGVAGSAESEGENESAAETDRTTARADQTPPQTDRAPVHAGEAGADTGASTDEDVKNGDDGEDVEHEEDEEDVEATRPTDSDEDLVRDRGAEALESWLFERERSGDGTWEAFMPLAQRFTREAKTRHLAMLLEEWVKRHVDPEEQTDEG